MALLIPPPKADRYLDVLALPEGDSDAALIAKSRQLLQQADKKLAADFAEAAEITRLVQTRAWVVEQLVVNLWRQLVAPNDQLALVAVGGFGRGDLQPHSDVDLLILTAREQPQQEKAIGQFVQALWDMGLEVGQATRTPKECLRQASADVTVATNLMEARFIHGHRPLFEAMRQRVGADSIWPGDAFFAAKLAEQKERHRRHGGTAYNLEPNIKEGPGGLRDIQMVGWVAHRHFNTQSLHGLVDAGFLEEHEYLTLQKGRRWLWKLRFALHQLAGRKEDRLLFDYQPQLAALFGYHDSGERNKAVEQFMQAYYRWAMRLERLNLRLLQLFDESILKANHRHHTTRLDENFLIVNDFIEASDPSVFRRDMQSWFAIFLHLQENPQIQGIRASTVRAMRRHIEQVDSDAFRTNPAVQSQFLAILKHPNRVTEQLLRMNRLGILGRYLPPWRKIIGRMQYDLFHMYTVDQHNLFVVRNLRLLRQGKTGLAFAEEQMQRIDKPHVLYLAGLFHDIAKGREGSHAVLGASDARAFAKSHGLPPDEAALLEWLVRQHLAFSITAQKKDLSDPQVIHRFAQVVGNEDRLRALYLLTIADIAGTDPKLWNDFKDSLMRELFVKTRAVLGQASQPDLQQLRQENRQKSRQLLQQNSPNGWQAFFETLPDHVFNRYSPEKIAAITQTIVANGQADAVVTFSPRPDGLQELLVYAPDNPGLFFHIARSLQDSGYNVVEARVSSTTDGRALDVFFCQPAADALPVPAATEKIRQAVLGQQPAARQKRRYLPRRLRHFHFRPQIHLKAYENDPSEDVMEVVCSDRPGVLADIAETLLQHGAEIHGAKIATFGNRVEDTFWISATGNHPLTADQRHRITHALEEKLNESR